MKDFDLPSFVVNKNYEDSNTGEFHIEPLERGLGNTIGNSLRRTLLSLLPGSAVFAIQVEGAMQEFTALKGVVEDVPQIVLNIKNLVVKIDSSEEDAVRILKLDVVGPKEVTAADIEIPSDVKIFNKDLKIATVADGGHLEITMQVNKGRGFVLAERNKQVHDMPIGTIPVDSNYSPVKSVSIEVGNARVGNSSNYDSLKLRVETNGSMAPSDAVCTASKILTLHFQVFETISESTENVGFASSSNTVEPSNRSKDLQIEELDLSVRSYNCLKRAGITTITELCQKSEEDMLKIKNLGKKSFDEVIEKLKNLGLTLKDKKIND